MMKYHFIDTPLPYTGVELANHWIYKNFGILGDAIVSFVGPCEVDQTRMVDLEDVLNDDYIFSPKMLHFIVEIFGLSLQEGVLLQRLFSSTIQGKLNAMLNEESVNQEAGQAGLAKMITRRGDDLFFEDTQKLSVSICTLSPTSILIHTGLNIDPTGAPVAAAGLATELGMDSMYSFSMACMKTLAEEWEDIRLSCCKVRAVY